MSSNLPIIFSHIRLMSSAPITRSDLLESAYRQGGFDLLALGSLLIEWFKANGEQFVAKEDLMEERFVAF